MFVTLGLAFLSGRYDIETLDKPYLLWAHK